MTYYPPENGRGEVTFEKWYVDDVSGVMYPRSRVFRDRLGRVVRVLDEDALDRDDLSAGYPLRTEADEDADLT